MDAARTFTSTSFLPGFGTLVSVIVAPGVGVIFITASIFSFKMHQPPKKIREKK